MDAPPALLAAEEATAALSHFAREFARPVRAMRLALGRLVASPSEPPDGPDHIGPMVAVCEELLELTDDYTNYVWIVLGGRPPHLRPVPIASLLADLDRRVLASAEGRSWSCAREGPDALVAVDPALCGEVIVRLSENALRYTPPGASIRVTVARTAAGVRIVVADDGPGIPVEERERVFEPFARLARDIRAGIPGAGLGLAFCRALVDRMGGTITIQGPPEGGAHVVVEWPSPADEPLVP